MARLLIREAHGGETRIIGDGALPYFLNQGYVVLETLDDEDDASPLYLSKAEGDLRWAKITDLGDPASAEVAVISEAVADSEALRAAFDAPLRAFSRSAQGAVTISWDDGWIEWHNNLLPRLRDAHPTQRHTFAVTPGLLGSTANYMTPAQAQALVTALPHCEIASHSQTHANMKDLAVPARTAEYDNSLTNLKALFPGREISSFVYPFGGIGADMSTHRELWGRYDRIVTAGLPLPITPLTDRLGLFLTPRPEVWNSATHQRSLDMVRLAASQPVIVNIYSHRPGVDMTLAELDELLTLCDTLGVPVVNIRDAYPGGGLLPNYSAEQGTVGWTVSQTGTGKTFDVVNRAPATGLPGTKAFHLASTNDTDFVYAFTSTYIPVQEGRSYTFSGRADATLTSGAGYARLRIQPVDQYAVNTVGAIGSSDVAGGGWARVTAAGTMPANTRAVRLDMILNGKTGDAWFDHLHFGLTRDGDFG